MPDLSASASWNNKCIDLKRLEEIRSDQPDTASKELVARAYIVMLVASWEAFCEDLASEALQHIVKFVPSPEELPTEVKKRLAAQLEKEKHDLAVWRLAGDRWRGELETQLATYQLTRDRNFNTPKSENVRTLFKNAIGLPDVTAGWRWQRMSPVRAAQKLDEVVSLRGAIAHRATADAPVLKEDIEKTAGHIGKLVQRSIDTVCEYVEELGIDEVFCEPADGADCL